MPRKKPTNTTRKTNRRQAKKRLARRIVKTLASSSKGIHPKTFRLDTATDELRAIFDATNVGISMSDLEGHLVSVNNAVVRLHGYARKEEVLGRRVTDLISENDRARAVEITRNLVENEQTVRAEYMLLRKDGSEFLGEISAVALRDVQGQTIGVIEIMRDITQQRLAEETLKSSQEFAKNIIGSSLDMIIAVDTNRKITEFNKAAEEVFGYRRDEVLGQSINLLYADPSEGQAVHQMTTVHGHELHTILNRKKNGQVFPSLLSASILRDGSGEPIGMMGISRDITESKRAEEEQKQLFDKVRDGREQLQRLSKRLLEVQEQERREIARELHDEIGQAITIVQLTLQNVQARIPDADAKSKLEDAIGIVEQILQTIRNLSLNLRPSILDDFGLIPALRWYFENQSLRTGLNIEFDAKPIPERLREEIETVCFRVAQEAVTNIIRHANAQNVKVGLERTEFILELTIQDDGIGFQVANILRKAKSGASLGLLGMQERVHLVGGGITIDSASGQGTLIEIVLPVNRNQKYAERRRTKRNE